MFLVFLFQTSEKFLSNQVIIKLVDREYLISEIPYPAVTFCPKGQGFTNLDIFTRFKNQNFTDSDLKAFQALDLIHDQRILETLNVSLSTDAFVEYLKNQTPVNWFKTVFDATWTWRFDIPITEIITKRGICMSFNLPSASTLLHLNR